MGKVIKNLESKISNNTINNIANNTNSNNKETKAEIIIQENNNYIDVNTPTKLKFKEIITNSHSNSGWLRQFIVFKKKNDNNDYLAYNNKFNYNIDILRIRDKKLIRYLKGHRKEVSVIKYYNVNDNDLLLSCDENKIVIIWDLNTFSMILKNNIKMEGYIWDAAVILDYPDDYFYIIPSNSDKENTRVYTIKNQRNYNNYNLKLFKEIHGTLNNKTNYIIPWRSGMKYYLIEICNSKISINSIFDDENYTTFSKAPEGIHCCAYLHQENYLYVTDYQNNFIRLWNLFSKSIDFEINVESNYLYGIVPWDKNYAIITCSEGLIVIDMFKGIVVQKIFEKKASNLCGIQKINSTYFGESIICSSNNGSIVLFNEN